MKDALYTVMPPVATLAVMVEDELGRDWQTEDYDARRCFESL